MKYNYYAFGRDGTPKHLSYMGSTRTLLQCCSRSHSQDFDLYLRAATFSEELNDSCLLSILSLTRFIIGQRIPINQNVSLDPSCSFVIGKKLCPSIFNLILVWP